MSSIYNPHEDKLSVDYITNTEKVQNEIIKYIKTAKINYRNSFKDYDNLSGVDKIKIYKKNSENYLNDIKNFYKKYDSIKPCTITYTNTTIDKECHLKKYDYYNMLYSTIQYIRIHKLNYIITNNNDYNILAKIFNENIIITKFNNIKSKKIPLENFAKDIYKTIKFVNSNRNSNEYKSILYCPIKGSGNLTSYQGELYSLIADKQSEINKKIYNHGIKCGMVKKQTLFGGKKTTIKKDTNPTKKLKKSVKNKK